MRLLGRGINDFRRQVCRLTNCECIELVKVEAANEACYRTCSRICAVRELDDWAGNWGGNKGGRGALIEFLHAPSGPSTIGSPQLAHEKPTLLPFHIRSAGRSLGCSGESGGQFRGGCAPASAATEAEILSRPDETFRADQAALNCINRPSLSLSLSASLAPCAFLRCRLHLP